MQFDRLHEFPIKEFHNVPRGLIGAGAYELVGVEAKNLGFKKTLLMTSGLRGTDIVDDIAGKLRHQGIDVVVFDKVESNPKDYNVMDAYQVYKDEGLDSFVSVGGGSTHDACKGARIVAAHDGRNINEFEGFNQSTNPVNPPHIAISTTAGTGSETSWAYVITDTSDPENPHKYVAFDDRSIATLAICDPILYYDLPTDLTAFCGFDILAHGSEPYVSRLDFPPSLGQAYTAVEWTNKWLRKAVAEPHNYEARTGLMWAHYIAAQAFNSGGLGIVHSISHAVSAFYDSHHGLNNAIALPHVWEYNLSARYERYAHLAKAMGVETKGLSTVQRAEAAVEAAIRLADDVGIPKNFKEVGEYSKNRMNEGVYEGKGRQIKGDENDVERISKHILGDSCTPGNPMEVTYERMKPVVRAALSGSR
ncbi:NDMA-dependent methanol dehydrogenase [Patulibacter minatonensis]|uniref:NDMA-dependent methanol dehydrogenase n=1 Tax=Patulibacter minatonensis TaxID=298163 RepID=UPI000478B3E7|nr:NDMA-dependent methanol dehydrogenase [Patulibacter minatonensis]